MADEMAPTLLDRGRRDGADWLDQGYNSPQVGLSDRVKFNFVRGMFALLMRLMGLRGLYWFGCVFGTCEWLINYRLRRRVSARLKEMLGNERSDREISRATHRYFTRLRCDKILYLIFDSIPRKKILNRTTFVGQEYIDAALRGGKGVYILLSHHGAHHVAALLMALQGYKTAGVRDRKESALRRYVQWKYSQTFPEYQHLRWFFADGFPRGVYRCFHENFVVGTALDVNRDRGKHLKTVRVTLFGQPQNFLTGTAQIALRCGAPILQGFVVSCKDFRFKLVVKEPLVDPAEAADTPECLQRIMQSYVDNIEAHVRHYPCHISKV